MKVSTRLAVDSTRSLLFPPELLQLRPSGEPPPNTLDNLTFSF